MDVRHLLAGLSALSSLSLGCQPSEPATSGDASSGGSSDETAAYESSSSYTDGVVGSSSSSTDDGSSTDEPVESSSSSSDESSGTTANTQPTAEPDTYLIAMGQTHTVPAVEGVLVNDVDADGLEVIATELVTDAGATVELRADGSFVYSTPTDWWGEDGFDYTLSDSATTGSVRIVVHPTTITNGMLAAGQGGFAMLGEDPSGLAGSRVAGAGDVNGDGLSDVIVGGSVAGEVGNDRVYVVFGKADDEAVQLGSLADDDAGFAIESEPQSPYTGRSIDGAGDVNGDGLADLVIQGDAGEFGEVPRVYVVFGKADTQTVSLTDVVAGVGGFVIDGSGDAPEQALAYVAGAGDVDGDGLGDVITGCQRSPQSYVIFGKADTSPVSLATVIGGEGGFVLVPENDAAYYSFSVGPAGDVDGDGLADVVVGNPSADGGANESGRIYVVFGKADNDAVDLASLGIDGGGFAIDGEQAYDGAGGSVRSAGDVDGDGLADVVIGATDVYDGPIAYAGRTYVVYGKADTESVPLQTLVDDGAGFMMTGEAEQDLFGFSVSGAGDVDGDGRADIIAGSSWPEPNGSFSGRTYVIYGDPTDPVVDLAAIRAGIGGFAAEGDAPYKNLGHRVAAAGDVDGDGFGDVILGGPGTDAGYAYIVRGGDFTLGATR